MQTRFVDASATHVHLQLLRYDGQDPGRHSVRLVSSPVDVDEWSKDVIDPSFAALLFTQGTTSYIRGGHVLLLHRCIGFE